MVVGGLQLPQTEDFGYAFDGKTFVRIPAAVSLSHLSHLPPSKPARLRREAPAIRDSLWLPDHCVVADNLLEVERLRWRTERRWNSAAHRGVGSRATTR